jgi:hypothetical protein
MSEHVKIDTDGATPVTDIDTAMAEIRQQLGARDDRIAELEKRLDDQEYSVRRVLDMLIEWLEDEQPVETDSIRDVG